MDPKIAKALREPFPADQIGKLPRAGIQLDYVGHAATLSRLIEVFPALTWAPMGVDEQGIPILTKEGLSPGTKMGLWITMTIDGVTRPGFGDGNTIKECLSDAIRNAAMRFGVALDLWSKEDLQSQGSGANAGEPSVGGHRKVAGAAEKGTPRDAAPASNSNGKGVISPEDQQAIIDLAKSQGVDKDALYSVVREVADVDKLNRIPLDKYEAVLYEIQMKGVPFG